MDCRILEGELPDSQENLAIGIDHIRERSLFATPIGIEMRFQITDYSGFKVALLSSQFTFSQAKLISDRLLTLIGSRIDNKSEQITKG